MRDVHAFYIQAAYTVLANARGTIDHRLARWLRMAHDCTGTNLHLAHELFALMLGVRRAGLTAALHELEARDQISTARSWITGLNRDGLEQSVCGLYGVPEAEFQRLLASG